MTKDSITIDKLRLPFDAVLPMPGSKSQANRAIIAACLTEGTMRIQNATPCDDVALLVDNLQKIGFAIQWIDPEAGVLEIRGGIPRQVRSEPTELFCGNAGTTVRFLTALCCLVPGQWIVTGDEHMQKRPIGDLVAALKELGADITTATDCPPIHIRGGTITKDLTTLTAAKSSQYLTALLLIAPSLPNGLTIEINGELTSPTYVALTEKVLHDFGVSLQKEDNSFAVLTKCNVQSARYEVEGDWSAVGAFLVLAEITGSRIRCSNLSPNSSQGDRKLPVLIKLLRSEGDQTIDCTDTPDQLMNLAVLAAHRTGTTTFTGAANLRHKECDRLAVLTQELTKVGIDIREHPDGVIVRGKTGLKAAVLDPHNDHRMAMAFAILGCLCEGIQITNPGCVSKSYPRFFADLQSLHQSPRCIAIIGMRASGKTNLAEKLAAKLKLKHRDSDAVFVKAAGSIRDFVEKHGWELFREGEEHAVAECLVPGSVVSLGGGAVESALTRKHLDQHAVTIWLQVDEKTIVKRLQKLDRPTLTELPLEQEVHETMERRNPQYAEVADILLPESTPFKDQIPLLIRELQKRCSW